MRALPAVVALAGHLLAASVGAAEPAALAKLPHEVPRAAVPGRWDRIALPTRGSDVRRLLVDDQTLWVGTMNGLAYYDGDVARRPVFAREEETTALIVNDMVRLPDGSILVATINGTLWRADRKQIRKLLDLNDRTEFSLVSRADGSVEIASERGLYAEMIYRQVEAAVSPLGVKVTIRKDSASRMVEVNGQLFSIQSTGNLYAMSDQGDESKYIARVDGYVFDMVMLHESTLGIATSEGCYAVSVQGQPAILQLSTGPCLAISATSTQEFWLATEHGVFLQRLGRWTQYFGEEAVEINPVGAFASDRQGNLWVGGSHGVWRLYNHSSLVALPGELGAIANVTEDATGNLVVGFLNGAAGVVSRDRTFHQVDVGVPRSEPNNGYYPGALLTREAGGTVWILNHNGLFRLEGDRAVSASHYPFPEDIATAPVITFAVKDRDNVYAGRVWSTAIYRLTKGTWEDVKDTPGELGGSAVPSVAFDAKGRLWALSSTQVHVLEGESWQDFGPFEPAADAKGNLFGSLVADPRADGVIANGSWGYPVLVREKLGKFAVEPQRPDSTVAMPYLFRQVIAHGSLGIVAATENGLMRWDADTRGWKPFTVVDPRLEAAATYLAPAAERGIWLVAKDVYQVSFPPGPPVVDAMAVPGEVIHSRSAAFQLRLHGLSGPPEQRRLRFSISPSHHAASDAVGTGASFTLAELSDGVTYTYEASALDAYGNASPVLTKSFVVRLPWYENPAKATLAMLAAVASVVLIITRRGPTGFILRILGGRRWHLATSSPDLEIEISQPRASTLEFRIRAPAKHTTVEASALRILEPSELDALRGQMRSLVQMLDSPGLSRQALQATAYGVRMLGSAIYNLLPPAVQLSYEQSRPGAIRLLLADSLMDLPWELWRPGKTTPMAIDSCPARTVVSGILAQRALAAGIDLHALIFSPSYQADRSLPKADDEVRRVAARIVSWGARATVLPGNADKEQVLAALAHANLFHYVGHAHFDAIDPSLSYLLLASGSIAASEIADRLQNREVPLYLAFINGCGSSRESAWQPGANAFGLASPFLRNATYFIGTQWPVQDEFAADFSDAFYASLFPRSQALLWHWLRRRNLAGASIGAALRTARQNLYEKTENVTAATWPAYVYYGDPSAQLTLS